MLSSLAAAQSVVMWLCLLQEWDSLVPAGASWPQLWGMALLCGIGFTMSLFIGQLAFPAQPMLVEEAKLGVLAGSLLSALLGFLVLRTAPRPLDRTPGQRDG